ncbi:unnamed protein product [Arabis nemorensis]|uniref:F-box domain-containing protein n=1 Tax=Arabis nemorensis TaxID=586526 RepID=A0A565CQ73_9BRAS|nr:unnamed protein product [Arabis nemorensis]
MHKICNLKRLSETSEEKINNAKFCLPSDLVAVILSCLPLKDNIRSSLVCKTWFEIGKTVI